jgi:hypothetical protein
MGHAMRPQARELLVDVAAAIVAIITAFLALAIGLVFIPA